MTAGPSLEDILAFADWERSQWRDWMRKNPGALQVAAGPSSDGRFQIIGDLVRHIFSGEKRYIDRLMQQPITDTSTIPTNDVEALFNFGERSRQSFRQYIGSISEEEADTPKEMDLMGHTLTASPKKIATHILLHEIRHWAQIATLLRLRGAKVEMHDLILSPIMGGSFRRAAQ